MEARLNFAKVAPEVYEAMESLGRINPQLWS